MNAINELTALFQAPHRPTLPDLLALPFSRIPTPIHSTILARAINILFAMKIREGEFEFLKNRILVIQVRDLKVEYCLRYIDPVGFMSYRSMQSPDLAIRGTMYDFLALITRREDSDTLFFNRRVIMEGNTALGLELKNLLDGMDLEEESGLLPLLLQIANRLMNHHEKHLSVG